MKILFICSSNVCRSPYCEFMLRKMIAESDVLKDKNIEVSSSAVFNKSKEIFPMAVETLKKEGFSEKEIKAHKPSFKWSAEYKFEDADIIIGMSKMHFRLTPKKYRHKYVSLSEIATGYYVKIPDPFLAKSQEDYDLTMDVLKEYLLCYLDILEKQYIKNIKK